MRTLKTSDAHRERLTARRVGILVVYSIIVWYAVAGFVRHSGASGAFTGRGAVSTYIATIVVTVPLNWFARRIVGMSARSMLQVAAVCAVMPPLLEGLVMRWYPQFYGGDPATIGAGAVWILFAIGVGLGMATVTSLRASGRLEPGDQAPRMVATNVEGATVVVPDPDGRLTHVQFLRFAGCPVCNLQLQPYRRRSQEIWSAGVREVIVFHSDAALIVEYQDSLPFNFVADPQRVFYRKYNVERSLFAILNPLAIPGLLRGYLLKRAGRQDSTPFGLPAEFLIDAGGTILACHYGDHAGDQWTVDELLNMVAACEQPVLRAGLSGAASSTHQLERVNP